MAGKVTTVSNEQGFQVIVMPGIAQHSLFEKNCCDLCGMPTGIEDNVYYESVIDNFYCEECHYLYMLNAVRYKPDIEQENINFEKVKRKLEGEKWWEKDLF